MTCYIKNEIIDILFILFFNLFYCGGDFIFNYGPNFSCKKLHWKLPTEIHRCYHLTLPLKNNSSIIS
jgi:hypothetical protein